MALSASESRVSLLVVLGALTAALSTSAYAGTVGATAITPSTAAVGIATTVTVTSVLTDPAVIPSTVVLQSLSTTGTVVAAIGNLHDDGRNGDAVANDKTYTIQTTVYQTTPGPVTFRVSVGFQGSLVRSFSSPLVVNVSGTAVGINILTPANLAYVNTSPINVTGTVGDPNAKVAINGTNAPVTGGKFLATIPLVEGLNTLTAVATNTGGTKTTATVQVILDTTPPHLTIDSPQPSTTTTAATITVTGTANDVVVGTVNQSNVQVTVNSITAQVANRTYTAANIPLTLGVNTIQAVGKDQAGNGVTVTTTITRVSPSNPPPPNIGQGVITYSLSIISGNNQTGAIATTLPAPLIVSLIDSTSKPVANQTVVFRVTGNNGTVTAGGQTASALPIKTGANGQAQVAWNLGQRSGAGINTVEASTALAVGPVDFTATGTASNAAQINVDSGNNQTGALGAPLAFPFVAVVTDSGHNRVPNVSVTFTVTQGGGNFGGQPSLTTSTDPNGRALATLTLGTQPGNDNNVVTANFPGNPGLSSTFTASAKAPGNPANTTISGVVLDNSNNPIQGVTMRVYQTNQANNNGQPMQIGTPVPTNAQGSFLITGAPVGFFKLMADGTTALGPKSYPTLEYDIVTVAGQNNTVGTPIYLPALDTVDKLCVSPTQGGTLTLSQSPGFALTVAAGTATFPGNSKTGCITVTTVNGDKVPMAPGFGQQPRFIVSIQPVGTVFNPPAPMTIPNVDGLKPKSVTEMYSYDHDLSEFVAIGTGTVSSDGSVIASNTGTGVLKAGWHCGGNPNSNGSAGSLSLSVAPTGVTLAPNQTASITANGGPPLDGSYGWQLLATQSGDDTTAATLTSAPTCPDSGSCVGTIQGVHAGQLTLRVFFVCSTTGAQVTQDVRVIVLSANVDVNDTTVTSDDITSLNPVQTIPVRITLNGGAATITLAVNPGGRGSLDQTSLTLAAGGMADVTFTPASKSASANDTAITVSYMGSPIGTGNLTVVQIIYPAHITTANNPMGVPDRIPPRANTPVTLQVMPDLTGSGQLVRFMPMNNGATNGDFTLDGAAMEDLTTTTVANLSGTVQTAPTGGLGGGNAGNLEIVAMVRGQANAISPGFTVAALPSGMVESSGGPITTCSGVPCYGLAANVVVNSDSGVPGDLDQVDFSEQVAVDSETGNLVGLGGGRNSGYLSVTGGPYADSHTTGIHPWTDAAGTQVLDQTHIFRDKRTGVNNIPIPQSGYNINRNVFATPAPGMGFSLKTSKGGAATTANGYSSTAGAPAVAFSVTQP